MKKIELVEGRAILIDYEKEEISPIQTESFYTIFDRMFVVPEDCEIRYKDGKKTFVKKAEKNDVLIVFSDRSWTVEPIAILKNAELKKNIIERQADLAARRAKDTVYAEYEPCSNCDLKSCC